MLAITIGRGIPLGIAIVACGAGVAWPLIVAMADNGPMAHSSLPGNRHDASAIR